MKVPPSWSYRDAFPTGKLHIFLPKHCSHPKEPPSPYCTFVTSPWRPAERPAGSPKSADAGVDQERIYEDRASGRHDHRPGLEACLKALQPGNTSVVWKLDRLGRNLKPLVTTVEELHDRGAGRVRARTDRRPHPRRPDCGGR